MEPAVRVNFDPDRIATILIDLPGKSVNTLTKQVWADLDRAIDEIEGANPRAVIVASGKPKSFIAGADLFEIRAMTNEQLHRYLEEGQRILDRLERLDIPTVAAINGDALGGGLEVALACRYRMAADEAGIKLGLPEVTLGLVPGWGGTVRLPRLIGLSQALPMLTGGKPVSPPEALELGLVDAIGPRETLQQLAREIATKKKPVARRAPTQPPDWHGILSNALREAKARDGEHLPAPARLIQIVHDAYDKGVEAGFAAERKGLVDLRQTEAAQNLLRAFFLRAGAKKAAAEQVGSAEPYPIKSAAVFGGGTMGSGIAYVLLRAGLTVRLIEANDELAQAARARVNKLIDDDISAGRLADSKDPIANLTASADWAGIDQVDLIVEAIIEDPNAKRELFGRLDSTVKPEAVLATNTSSLSVTQIAESTRNPRRVIGLHFFNPVGRMPLVEIVRTKHTDPRAAATGVAVATMLGKVPVVASDGPGFIVNRVLMPYLSEAMRMAQQGVPVPAIDDAMKKWGMPMGPFVLLDQIGLDVIAGIFKAMHETLGDRVVLPRAVEDAVKSGALGRKSGRGFYIYGSDRKAAPVLDEELASALRGDASAQASEQQIQQRLMKAMCDESDRLLKEGVTDSPDAIDLATLTGLGIAPFRGGVARYAEALRRGVGAVAWAPSPTH